MFRRWPKNVRFLPISDQKTSENSFNFCCVKYTFLSLNFNEYMIKPLATLALSDSVYKMLSSNLGLPPISGGNTSHRTNLMFVQDETLAGNRHFATKIPSRDKK